MLELGMSLDRPNPYAAPIRIDGTRQRGTRWRLIPATLFFLLGAGSFAMGMWAVGMMLYLVVTEGVDDFLDMMIAVCVFYLGLGVSWVLAALRFWQQRYRSAIIAIVVGLILLTLIVAYAKLRGYWSTRDVSPEWKLHEPTEDNVFLEYNCGLVAGQRVALKRELVVRDHLNEPTGKVHPKGEIWQVLPGLRSDPVLWFRQPDGSRCTWKDAPAEREEWFEIIDQGAA